MPPRFFAHGWVTWLTRRVTMIEQDLVACTENSGWVDKVRTLDPVAWSAQVLEIQAVA